MIHYNFIFLYLIAMGTTTYLFGMEQSIRHLPDTLKGYKINQVIHPPRNIDECYVAQIQPIHSEHTHYIMSSHVDDTYACSLLAGSTVTAISDQKECRAIHATLKNFHQALMFVILKKHLNQEGKALSIEWQTVMPIQEQNVTYQNDAIEPEKDLISWEDLLNESSAYSQPDHTTL